MRSRIAALVLAGVLTAPGRATIGAQSGDPDVANVRLRWGMWNAVVYADSTDGVRVWVATDHRLMRGRNTRPAEISEGFVPDSVTEWTEMTRQLLALTRPPVPGDTAPVVSSGFLRGRTGATLIAARSREGDRLRDSVRLLYSSKQTSLLFDLSATDVAAFVSALQTVALHAPRGTLAATVVEDSATEVTTMPAQGMSPILPAEMRRPGRHGEVWVDFYVDSTGRADLPSVRTVLSDDADFELAVRGYLVRARFIPATVHGRPVRGRAHQRFGFEVSR